MPRAKQPRAKRANRKRVIRRRRVGAKENQMAQIKETFSFQDLSANIAYATQIDLSLFPRATDLADNFQEYRITKLEFKYMPQYDTYADAANAPSLPNLYTKREIYPAPTTFGLDYLKAMGAKPRRLDDKTLTVSYTPNTYLLLSGGFGNSKPIWKPWLSTHYDNGTSVNTDKTPHYGHSFFIEQLFTNPVQTKVCQYEITAYFEFRKPWDLATVKTDAPKAMITMKA